MTFKFLFLSFFFGANLWMEGHAQTFPSVPHNSNPSLPGPLGKLPNGLGMEALGSKPKFPYLRELKQIQSLKQSYDSLKSELKEIKQFAKDSTQRDSLLIIAKERGREVLEKESQVLESLIESEDIQGDEIKNAASRTLEGVNASKEQLSDIQNFEGLEALMDQNEENLKALTNEWIMPKVEQVLSGTMEGNLDPTQAKIPDFYGKGALEKLVQDGVPTDVSFDQAKSIAKEKALHLSDSYVEELKGKYSKVKFDSLGNIQIIQEAVAKRKFVLWEENKLKDAAILERIGLYAWYDPLTSFGEGIYGDVGLTYQFTHQLQAFGGMVFRRVFSDGKELSRTGQGAKLSLRFAKGNWFVQTEMARVKMKIDYPVGFDDKDFEGMKWNTGLGFGRVIPIGDRIQSVVLTTWDPTYSESKCLSNSPFQLKIGFEWIGLKGLKKSGIDLEDYKEKIPTDRIMDKLKKQNVNTSPNYLQ